MAATSTEETTMAATQAGTELDRRTILPRQIWGLLMSENGEEVLVAPSNEHAGRPFLAYASRSLANDAAKEHAAVYGIGCRPVRLA
jgi:hypothetical protein